MPPPSKIELLPKADREWLDAALVQGGFSGYEALAAALKERGIEIGKSAIHRHGQHIQRRLAAIQASTQAAALIVDSTADAEDKRSAALISLTQHELFEALVNLEEAGAVGEDGKELLSPADRVELLGKAAHGISQVVRASVTQKKFAAEIRRVAMIEAASAAKQSAKAQGLSEEKAEAIRKHILGLPG